MFFLHSFNRDFAQIDPKKNQKVGVGQDGLMCAFFMSGLLRSERNTFLDFFPRWRIEYPVSIPLLPFEAPISSDSNGTKMGFLDTLSRAT